MMQVFEKLTAAIDLVYFDRADSTTAISEFMKTISRETRLIDSQNLDSSREVIATAKVDILLYLALPTEKYTFLLAHAR